MVFGANGQLKAVSDRIESCARNGESLQRLAASRKAHGPTKFLCAQTGAGMDSASGHGNT